MAKRHEQEAERFEAIIERCGGWCRTSRAETGSIYVTVGDRFVARFADHASCYGREDISVDDYGCTLRAAVEAAAKACELDATAVSRSVTAFKAAATRAERGRVRMEQALAKWRAMEQARLDALAQERREELPPELVEYRRRFRDEWIAVRYPDFDGRSKRSQKNIKYKACRAWWNARAAGEAGRRA